VGHLMKKLVTVLLCLAAVPAWADCNSDDIVTNGATFGARSATGRPLITIEAVGGVAIQRRGDGSGSFTVSQVCDPAYAADLRAKLERLLKQEDLASR